LKRFNLIQTLQEQRCYLLCNAVDSALEDTPFSIRVKCLLKAALALDERTRDLELRFKNSTNAKLDLLLKGSKILVNKKWLNFYLSYNKMLC
jgi:hypothetical protein